MNQTENLQIKSQICQTITNLCTNVKDCLLIFYTKFFLNKIIIVVKIYTFKHKINVLTLYFNDHKIKRVSSTTINIIKHMDLTINKHAKEM